MIAARFAMRDLLIAPDAYRYVVADKGATWVSDRFVAVRADLFKKVPGPKLPADGTRVLTVSMLRLILGSARGAGIPLQATSVAHVATDGTRSTLWRVGSSLICLNEKVTRTYYLADLRPRYVSNQAIVAWYGQRRGREVLMAVQKPVTPFDLKLSELVTA